MKKIRIIFLLLMVSFGLSSHTLKSEDILLTGGDFDEGWNKAKSGGIPSVMASIEDDVTLNITISIDEVVYIRVVDQNNSPIYMSEFRPGTSSGITVDLSNWSSGSYKLIFTKVTGQDVTSGTFKIN